MYGILVFISSKFPPVSSMISTLSAASLPLVQLLEARTSHETSLDDLEVRYRGSVSGRLVPSPLDRVGLSQSR